MEPVKGGLLANPPETVVQVLHTADPSASAASWAVRFAASLDNVMIVLSGISSEAQMADNLSFMKAFRPLSPKEEQTVAQARAELCKLDRIPCTGCGYCTRGCPMGIEIPDVFSVMNVYKTYGDLEGAKRKYAMSFEGKMASRCVQCGQCESVCPQHLPIMKFVQETAAAME